MQAKVRVVVRGLTAGAFRHIRPAHIRSDNEMAELALRAMIQRPHLRLIGPSPIPAFRSWGAGELIPSDLARISGPIRPTSHQIFDAIEVMAGEGGISAGVGSMNHRIIATQVALYLSGPGTGLVSPIIPITADALERLKGPLPHDRQRDLRLIAAAVLHATAKWATHATGDWHLDIGTSVQLDSTLIQMVEDINKTRIRRSRETIVQWLVSAYVTERFNAELGFNLGIEGAMGLTPVGRQVTGDTLGSAGINLAGG